MRTTVWPRQSRKSRVFCYQAGHDNRAWAEVGFRTVLARGSQWRAGGAVAG